MFVGDYIPYTDELIADDVIPKGFRIGEVVDVTVGNITVEAVVTSFEDLPNGEVEVGIAPVVPQP